MEGAALGLSPATPAFVKPGAAAPRRCATPGTRSGAVALSPAPRRPRRSPIRGLSGVAPPRSPLSSPVSCSSSGIRSWGPLQPPVSDRGNEEFKVRAASVPESAGESSFAAAAAAKPAGDGLMQTLHLGVLFVLWILFNIYFNIYNKQVLKAYPYPITITSAQFAMGTLFVLFAWATNLVKKPKISSSQLLAIVPLAIVHTLGNLFTNVSLGKVAVSFTHTIKAMEPFFSVFLSAMFLGEMPSFLVLLSLVPIVGGVALASLTEASFNWAGFLSAMASNLTNQSRNVFSKKIMANKEESLDNITLFSIITIMSFILMAPVTLLAEGVKFTPSYLLSAGLNLREIYMRSLLAGICFHAYQQVAYMILAYVSPVTLSVGNCVKRVVVIASSVLFFRTPVSPINSLGTGIALAGVFLYSRVKKLKPKPKFA